MSMLSEKLAPIWSAINRLQARQMSIFPATVTSVDPVRIRIDGESQPLTASPDVGVTVGPGDRVRVLRYGTSHLIVARMNTGRQPYAQAAGTVQVSVTSGSYGSTRVDFPPGRFTQSPVITLTPHSSASAVEKVMVWDRSSTGFTAYLWRSTSTTTTLMWHAIQMEA